MHPKIVVTGAGIISAIGNKLDEVYTSLISCKSGISDISILETIHKGKLPVGEIKLTNKVLMEMAGINDNRTYTRTTLLGTIAAKEAIKNAGISDVNELRTGLISATTVGGMCNTELSFDKWLDENNPDPYIDTHDCGDSTEKIALNIGLKGFITTINTACSSSINTIMLGCNLIKQGKLDRVIVGGTDALAKFTLNGFNTLMILDSEPCKPFDQNRKGLNLGEGAGFIVIESEETAKGKNILAEVKGFGNANDAYHQTASSPEGTGAFLAMDAALKTSGLKPGDIDYINVHGTGTQNNDLSEGKAIIRHFGNNIPPFSSTKPFTGHTLGAAGIIETIISILTLNNNFIPPSLNFETPIEEININPEKELVNNADIRNVLTNSFGFGGNNSSLILSKV